MNDLFTTQHLLAELRQMGIGACGTCRKQFWGFSKELKVGKNPKLPYHFQSAAVNDGVAILLWMDSCLLPWCLQSTLKWWGFTGTENEKASRQQVYPCKWSKFHISSWRMPERAWYTCYCSCLQPAQGGSRCSWPVSNLLWYAPYIQMQLVATFLLYSGDSPYQQPYNLSRSASEERAHCGSLWLASLHCAWPSVS